MSIVLDKELDEVKDVKGGVVGSIGEVASTVIGSNNTVSSGNVGSVGNVGSLGYVGSFNKLAESGSVGSMLNAGTSLNNLVEVKMVNLDPELVASSSAVDVEEKPADPVVYREYRYRYVIMFLYFLISNASGITGPVCSPIITNLSEMYGISQTVVNLASLISMIVFVPSMIPGNYILDVYGIKKGVLIGTALMLAGVWLRLLAKQSFVFVLLGQLLAAIGGPMLNNCPQKISAYWTSPKSRTMFTTLLILSGVLGGSIGFLLPGMIVGEESDPVKGKDLFVKLLLIEAIIATALCAPVFFLFREKPPTPPSASAMVKRTSCRGGYKLLLKNKGYLWLLGQQGCVLGAINSLLTVTQSLIDPFGFTQAEASVLGVLVTISSVLGCLLFGFYVQRVKKFKMPIIWSGFVALAAYGMFTGVLYTNNFYALATATFILGFVLSPCGPLAKEMACEITFPVGEALSGGVISCVIQLVCPAQTFIIGAIMDGKDKRKGALITLFMLMGFMVVGIICSFKLKEDLLRSKHDKAHEKPAAKVEDINPETPCPLVDNMEASPEKKPEEVL